MLSLSASPLFTPISYAEDAATRRSYQVPAGSLGAALTRFAGLSGVNLAVDPALVSGRGSSGLSGEYAVEEGFARLLQGSGLQLQPMGEQAYMLDAGAAGQQPATVSDLHPRDPQPKPTAIPTPVAKWRAAVRRACWARGTSWTRRSA